MKSIAYICPFFNKNKNKILKVPTFVELILLYPITASYSTVSPERGREREREWVLSQCKSGSETNCCCAPHSKFFKCPCSRFTKSPKLWFKFDKEFKGCFLCLLVFIFIYDFIVMVTTFVKWEFSVQCLFCWLQSIN